MPVDTHLTWQTDTIGDYGDCEWIAFNHARARLIAHNTFNAAAASPLS